MFCVACVLYMYMLGFDSVTLIVHTGVRVGLCKCDPTLCVLYVTLCVHVQSDSAHWCTCVGLCECDLSIQQRCVYIVFVKSDMCHTSLSPVHCSKLMCKCWTLAHVIVSLTVRVGFC